MNDDGTMARRPDLEAFAEQHELKIGTIADLIRYRLRQERSVERIAEQAVRDRVRRRSACWPTKITCIATCTWRWCAAARAATAPLVRVHPIDTLAISSACATPGRTWTLRDAMKRIAEVGTGVVIVLRDHTSPRELADAVSALGQRAGHAAPSARRRRRCCAPTASARRFSRIWA